MSEPNRCAQITDIPIDVEGDSKEVLEALFKDKVLSSM